METSGDIRRHRRHAQGADKVTTTLTHTETSQLRPICNKHSIGCGYHRHIESSLFKAIRLNMYIYLDLV